MPSFDVVSKTDNHEITNAVDQANRELSSRFDFKGTNARIELSKNTVTLIAPTDFQLKQVDEILRNKLSKRHIDLRTLDYKKVDMNLAEARQQVEIKEGLDTNLAKKVVKLLKESGIKVQGSIQADQVRVTGKKRDDLQEAIAMLREAKLDMPLQFENFRD
jgi:cyclic-di-GMP-binding protein